MAHPLSGSLCTIPGWNWNLEMLVFEERGIPEPTEKKSLGQGRELRTITKPT